MINYFWWRVILFNLGKLWADEEDDGDTDEVGQDEEDVDLEPAYINWQGPAAAIRFAGQMKRDELRAQMA